MTWSTFPLRPTEARFVPPFAIGNVPVTSALARFTARAAASSPPPVACRNPVPDTAMLEAPDGPWTFWTITLSLILRPCIPQRLHFFSRLVALSLQLRALVREHLHDRGQPGDRVTDRARLANRRIRVELLPSVGVLWVDHVVTRLRWWSWYRQSRATSAHQPRHRGLRLRTDS